MSDVTSLKPIVDKDHPVGQTVVPLSKIRTDYFSNYRSEIENVPELAENLRTHGQLQNIIGCWLEDGSVAVVAGFRRTEAMRFIALDDLTKQYNKENKLQPKDEQYIATFRNGYLQKILEGKPLEARKSLDEYPVKVDIIEYVSEVDTMFKAGSENEAREDVPLSDTLKLVGRLKGMKVKQKDIAKGLGKSEGTISQLLKINGLEKDIEEFLLDEESIKVMHLDKDALPVYKNLVKNLLAELHKRIEYPKNNERAVPFSHLRDLSFAVTAKEGSTLEPSALLEVLRFLVKYTDKPLGTATPDYGVFKHHLEDQAKLSSSIRRERLEAAKPKVKTDTSQQLTISDLQKKQEELKAKGGVEVPMEKRTDDDILSELTDGEDEDDNSAVSDVDDVIASLERDDTGIDELTDDSDVPSDESLQEIEAEQIPDELENINEKTATQTVGEVAVTTSRTQSMQKPASKYNRKNDADVHNWASMIIGLAKDKTNNMFERLANLQTSSFLLDTIGLEDERKQVEDVYETYLNGCKAYFIQLNELAKKDEAGYKTLTLPDINDDDLKGIE